MEIKEIKASSIISKSGIPGADFVINPYVGCSHACIYCYARFMKRFTGHAEPWGTFVDAKINAPELIPKNTDKFKGKSIYISSVTDAYMPIEEKYRLTRRILENLIPLQPNLSIQTKSDLVLRDMDLLKQFKNVEVGFTITTLDESLRNEIEPFASPSINRLNALKQFKAAGFRTFVFIGPIMPYLTKWKDILENTSRYTDHYLIDQLNPYAAVWGSVMAWLRQKYPNMVEDYLNLNNYWSNLGQEIVSYCKKERLNAWVLFG